MRSIVNELFYHLKYQYLATACANIITYCHGFGLSWYSSALLVLESEKTPLTDGPINQLEKAWLVAIYPIGTIVGCVLFGFIGHYFGQRTALIFTAFQNFILWISVIFCKDFVFLLVGRFFGGLTTGGMFLCVPLFVTEVADSRIRGALGSIFTFAMSTGTLCAFICGYCMEYTSIPYIVVHISIISLISMYFTPETPYFLVQRHKMEKAKKSLIYYNSGNDAQRFGYNVDSDLNILESIVRYNEEHRENLDIRTHLLHMSFISKMLTGIALVGLNTLSGLYIFNTNSAKIIEYLGLNVVASMSSIIFGILQVLCSYVSLILIDRAGRKILLIKSAIGSALFLIILGVYSILSSSGYHSKMFNWIPITCSSFFVSFASFGLRPMCFVYIAESLPRSIREIGFGICMIFINLFPILIMMALPVVLEEFGVHVVMWICSSVCISGILIAIFAMEETKGKNLNIIEK